ncbi:MAG: DUF2179 domain-containing protein [Oscillospiraceae bacterium]
MWLYVFIFFAKLVEVSLATVRLVLINRGEKLKGAAIGFFEVMIWVIVISNVLDGLSQDPIKLVVYCFAFACGNYFGVIVENKLAIGTAQIQVVVGDDTKDVITSELREKGFGITSVVGQGKDGPVDVLMIYLKRKAVPEAIESIHKYCPNALVTVNDVRQLRNGYIRK